MTQNTEHIDLLIALHLSGESSQEQTNELLLWIAASEANRKYFEHLQLIFNATSTDAIEQETDVDAAWQKVQRQIHKPQAKVFKMNNSMWFRIAAVLIAVIAVAIFILKNYFTPAPVEMSFNSSAATIERLLPDSTLVSLNKNSSIAYHFNPKTKKREVILNGEAFFKIHKNENEFLLKTGGLEIKDIGTAFNVKSFSEKDSIEVYVTEGEVMLNNASDKNVSVKAGKGVYYSKSRNEYIYMVSPDSNSIAYKTRILTFNNTSLHDVAQLFEEVYGTKMLFENNDISNCRLTATFRNENAEQVVDIITATFELKWKLIDKSYVLSGTGCKSKP